MDRHKKAITFYTELRMSSAARKSCDKCFGTGFLDDARQKACPDCKGVPYPDNKKKNGYDAGRYKGGVKL